MTLSHLVALALSLIFHVAFVLVQRESYKVGLDIRDFFCGFLEA